MPQNKWPIIGFGFFARSNRVNVQDPNVTGNEWSNSCIYYWKRIGESWKRVAPVWRLPTLAHDSGASARRPGPSAAAAASP